MRFHIGKGGALKGVDTRRCASKDAGTQKGGR